MEIELAHKRTVSVCIIGVRHDAVERLVTDKLTETTLPEEAVFWELWVRRPWEVNGGGHWGLEAPFTRASQFLFTLLIVVAFRWPSSPDEEHLMGSGQHPVASVEAQFVSREERKIWDALQ